MNRARRVELQVSIGGHEAGGYVSPCLLEFAYTDNATGKADELHLRLHDRDGKWSGEWKPARGTEIRATLLLHDWQEAGTDISLPCGAFNIDELELSGPPDIFDIKAVSADLSGELRETGRSRAWESFTLRGVAAQIAREYMLKLFYSGEDHAFRRRDQRGESDLAFLNRLAADCGMNCKVHDGKLILYDAADADAAEPGIVIRRRGDMYAPTSYRFRERSVKSSYTKVRAAYHDPAAGVTSSAEVQAGQSGKAEKTLSLDERVESSAQAIRLGRARLRKANKKSFTAELEMLGHPGIMAGITVRLEGFGAHDGTYSVEKAEHRVSPAYTTSVTLSRTLEY